METEKYYFRDEDSEMCHSLDWFDKSDFDEDEEITLIEAIPNNSNPEYIWCGFSGSVGDRNECKKSHCEEYQSKSGRGICSLRGKLFDHGEKVYFDENFKIKSK